MAMFTLIAVAVVILTALVILLSLLAVLARYLTDLRQARIAWVRKRMQRAVDEFLAGNRDVASTRRELGGQPDIALGVLIDSTSRLPREQRGQLNAFFEHFGFLQKELTALRARRWALRARAATRLGYMGHDAVVPELLRALGDESLNVRLAAAHGLAALGAASAAQPVLRTLALPAAWPLQRCTEILYEMGDGVTDPLLAMLNEQGPQGHGPSVIVAVRVLGMLRAERAAQIIGSYLNSPEAELRISSARALGQIGNASMVTMLTAALEDPVWEVRNDAALALGRLRDSAAKDALSTALADPAWWVRFNAAESLYRLGKEGLVALHAAMNGHVDAFARDISRQVLEEHGEIQVQEAQPA